MTETKPLAGVILFGFGRNCHQLVAVGEKKEKRAALAIFLDMSSLGRWIWRGRTELLVSLRRNGTECGSIRLFVLLMLPPSQSCRDGT